MPQSTPGISSQQFADDVLNGLGAPITQTNRSLVYAWVFSEGTKAQNNPLATTEPAQGATQFNSVGVKNYPDYRTGLDATLRTLTNGYYNGIVNDLRKGNQDPYNIVKNNASEFDKWGTGAGLIESSLGSLSGTPPGSPIKGASVTDVGANLTAGYTKIGDAVKKPLTDLEMKALYGLIMVGGILLGLLGLVLIGADIGIGILSRSKVTTPAKGVVNAINPRARNERKTTRAYSELERQNKSDVSTNRARHSAEKVKQEQARTSKLRAEAKRARGRNKPVGGKLPEGY